MEFCPEKGRDKKFSDLGMGEYKSPEGSDFSGLSVGNDKEKWQ